MKSRKTYRLGRLAVLSFLFAVCLAEVVSAVGTRRIALRSGADLRGGELKGVAVDSVGRVRAGFNLGNVPIADASAIWAALPLGGGKTLLATGNEGRLLELSGGVVREVAKSDQLVLTSLAKIWGGKIIVGSLPEGKLFEYTGGKLKLWLRLKDAEHVLQLAYDRKQQALFAATGPNGKLFRIGKDKKAQVYFDAEEQHLVSTAIGNGVVYAGAGDKAKLYEVRAPGRARVLFDFGRTEVRAIQVAANGDVYAIANEISKPRRFGASTKTPRASGGSQPKTKGKGTLYRFDKNGSPEQLIEDDSEHFVSLGLDAKGKPYVGTGAQGRVYTVDENHNSVLTADTEERQVTALLLSGAQPLVFASDPAVAHPVRGRGGADAVWTSKVIDLGLRARFGRLGWTAEGQLELATRSGNTKEPDDTWAEWSKPMRAPGTIASPPARFVQVRARFNRDADAVLSEVSIPFVTDNLRAIINDIELSSASSDSLSPADGKLRASGGPIDDESEAEVRLKWSVDNPDKDELRYRLHYRPLGNPTWFDMLEPHQKLTKNKYTWNTRDLPEGRYRVRVTASDERSNPPSQVKTHQLESHIVLVDNTAPQLQELTVTGRVVRGIAVDGVGPIARIEASIVGSDEWVPFSPNDDIFDEPREEFVADLSAISPAGPALVTLRVYDQENNMSVRSVTLR